MKKNTITIDLDRFVSQSHYTKWEIKNAQVPERCTLTEAVEKVGRVEVKIAIGHWKSLTNAEKVQQFKSQYLDKEETLEDGIYEVELSNSTQLVYVRNGKWSACKNPRVQWKATDLINPVKIANL